MKTIKNVLKLIMWRGVQVEKDYGRRGDTPPWAAHTRPHATIVPAKKYESLQLVYVWWGIPDDTACLLLPMFLMDTKDEGVLWPSDTLVRSQHPLEGSETISSELPNIWSCCSQHFISWLQISKNSYEPTFMKSGKYVTLWQQRYPCSYGQLAICFCSCRILIYNITSVWTFLVMEVSQVLIQFLLSQVWTTST